MGQQEPDTYVGQWLLAALLRQQQRRDVLGRKLNGGVNAWNEDEPAVVQAACELCVRMLFPSGDDGQGVDTLVGELVARGLSDPLDAIHFRAVVRQALGDADAADDMSPSRKFHCRVMVTMQVAVQLQLDATACSGLVRDAEQLATERGFHPPPASEPAS